MSVQQWEQNDTAPWSKFNETMAAAGQAFFGSQNHDAHSGLTVGVNGGNFDETTVADATLACTDDDTNYIVCHRGTPAFTVAITTTNWDNTTTYGRVARAVFASGVLTWHDERFGPGGIFASSSSIAAENVSITDTGAYFTGTDVEAALQEVGASLAALSGAAANIPAQRYTIELANTTDSDPGAGLIKFNNATPASATELYIDDSTSDGVDLSTFFASLGSSGFVKIQSAADAGEWAIFKWSVTPTDGTGYWKIAVTPQASKGTLDDGDAVLIEFDNGGGGSGGTELKGLTFTSDTGSTADSDPGAGLFKWNNATQGSATKLFVDNATLDSITATTFFADLAGNAHVFIQQGDDSTLWQLWKITGATADSGYYDFDVTLLAKSSSDIADAKTCYFAFTKTGAGAGSTQGTHDVTIPAGAMLGRIVNGATYGTLSMGAGKPEIPYYAFADGTQQFVTINWDPPKSWDRGTITAIFKWCHPSTTTNFGVKWGIRGVGFGDGETLNLAFGTAQEVADTGGATDTLYISAATSAMTIGGTLAARDNIQLEVYRLPSDGSDTLAVDARLIAVTLLITTNADTDA